MEQEMSKYAPVVVFAYNRVNKLENCLKYLEKCKESAESDLFIFCDGPKGEKDAALVKQVQEYALAYEKTGKFKTVTVQIQKKNRGLAASIIAGVTSVVNEFGKVIVVEDDNVVLPSFLKFLNDGLDYYRDDKNCGSISAFTYPMKILKKYDKDVFATRKGECSGGWGTWYDRWNDAEWADTDFVTYLKDRKARIKFERLEAGLDRLMYLQYKGKIDSWAIRWVYYLYRKGQLTVYPAKGQVINDGFDGSGTHSAKGTGSGFRVPYSEEELSIKWEKCEYNERLAKAYAVFPRRKIIFYIPETLLYMFIKRI